MALAALAGCSSDDDKPSATTVTTGASTGTTTAAPSAATIKFDKAIQQELIDVGCYAGAVDGIIGPETDAAIIAFQQADGLEVDGELGPETEAALKEAVAEGRKVCGSTTGTTQTTPTTANPASAPCTATAIAAALPSGSQVQSYVCSEGWAAGTADEGSGSGTKFILQDEAAKWAVPAQDPCGSASAGLPPVILEDGCA